MARRISTGDPVGLIAFITVSDGTGEGVGSLVSPSLGWTGIAFNTGLVGSGISSAASFSASGDGEGVGLGFNIACTELYGSRAASRVGSFGKTGFTALVSTARAARGNSDTGKSRVNEACISP